MSRIYYLGFISILFCLIQSCSFDCDEENPTGVTCEYIDYNEEYDVDTLFPWNSFDQVKLFVYGRNIEMVERKNLIQNDEVLIENIIQEITLNEEQTDSLKATFLNWKVTDKCGNLAEILDCGYSPHEAIIFYESNTPIAFFEIAYDCNSTEYSEDCFWGPYCDNTRRLERLKTFFLYCGADEWID